MDTPQRKQQQQLRRQTTLDGFFSPSRSPSDAAPHPPRNPRNASSTVDLTGSGSSTPRADPKPARTETRSSPSQPAHSQRSPAAKVAEGRHKSGEADMPHRNMERRNVAAPLCTYFAKGHCRYGKDCRFSHATGRTSPQRGRTGRDAGGNDDVRARTSPSEQHDSTARVRMPWDSDNTFCGRAGQQCKMWPLVVRVMKENGPDSSESLANVLYSLLVTEDQTSFDALRRVIDTQLTSNEKDQFFTQTIPWMKCLVIHSPSLFESGVPLLLRKRESSVQLTELQVCALLCCGFFSLFPDRSYSAGGPGRNRRTRGPVSSLAAFNFNALFNTDGGDATRGKIRCLLHYFQHQAARFPVDSLASNPFHRPPTHQTVMQYARVCATQFPDFSESGKKLLPVIARADGLIEECDGCLQVDFANRVVGGGVLRRGCVQEEIRFVISPELLISRLLSETLADNEAVIMSGSVQYSRYSGYASTFAFTGGNDVDHFSPGKHTMVEAQLPGEETVEEANAAFYACSVPSLEHPGARVTLPMANVCVVAMDAVDYNHGAHRAEDQYLASWVQREVRKAYASFRGTPHGCLPSSFRGPIATGNWGCGAFGGDLHLKMIIQWCAASQVNRPLRYFTFGNNELAQGIELVQAKLTSEEWTVGDLFTAVLLYSVKRMRRNGYVSSSASENEEEEAAAKKSIPTPVDTVQVPESMAEEENTQSTLQDLEEVAEQPVEVDMKATDNDKEETEEGNQEKNTNENDAAAAAAAAPSIAHNKTTIVADEAGNQKDSAEIVAVDSSTETYDSRTPCETSQDTVVDKTETDTLPTPYAPDKNSLFGFILSFTHRPTLMTR